MNAASPDRSVPHPDQESIDAWRAAAEARDHADIGARDAEEARAKAHSKPTRILGLLVLGGILMQVIAAISRQDIDLGGPLYLLAGIMILKGNQAWVRFVGFTGSLSALVSLFKLTWAQMLRHPVKLESSWASFGNLPLWIEFICPAAYLLALAILAFVVLRHRELPYWTRAVKASSLVVALVLLAVVTGAVVKERRNEELCSRFPAEIEEAKGYATSGFIMGDPEHLPALCSLGVYKAPNNSTHYPVKNASLPPGQVRTATFFMKLPSGEWRKLELGLIVDDAT